MKEKERYTYIQDNSKKPTTIKKKTLRYEGKKLWNVKEKERDVHIYRTQKKQQNRTKNYKI